MEPSACTDMVDNSFVSYIRDNHLKLLTLVPHQDDEINLTGSMLELWSEAGQESWCCFLTNGDYYAEGPRRVTAETRLKEAKASLSITGGGRHCHAIFLGYGDNYVDRDADIYRAVEPVRSHSGHLETYGSSEVGVEDFRYQQDGRHSPYTYTQLVADIRDVILAIRPDVILATDYDHHHDHRLLSIAFEEAMGAILNSAGNSYRPLVYKGFCYSTAYKAPADFYQLNLLPSLKPRRDVYLPDALDTENPTYVWEQRGRFPVAAGSRRRTLRQNTQYRALQQHASQKADNQAVKVINSDKVYWYWPTDSLTYGAHFTASSGETKYLHDYVRWYPVNLFQDRLQYACQAWQPDDADADKTFSVEFNEQTEVQTIVFYTEPVERPALEQAEIELSTGRKILTDKIQPWGRANTVKLTEPVMVKWLRFRCLAASGQPAVTEFEIYGAQPQKPLPVVKLLVEDNFAYHYLVTRKCAEVRFQTYVSDASLGQSEMKLVEGENCSLRDKVLRLQPGFRRAVIRLEVGACYDQIVVERLTHSIWMRQQVAWLFDRCLHEWLDFHRAPANKMIGYAVTASKQLGVYTMLRKIWHMRSAS